MGVGMQRLIGYLLVAGTISVCATEFYGVKLVAGAEDDLSGVIQGLLDGDRESAAAHLEHLSVVAPKLAKGLSLLDFEIPCADCAAKPSMDCKVCGGKLLWVSPTALRYLQKTFKTAMENGEPVGMAWAFAKQMFDERKALVLSHEPFKGTVLRVEEDGLLLKRDNGEIFFLAEESPSKSRPGQPVEGTCWPIKELSHSYRDADETFKSAPFFTRNLWWDY